MNYTEIEELLKKYNWILESTSPLNISSLDGEHRASNYAAEVVIEYLAMLDYSDNQGEKEATIERFKLIEKKKDSVKEPFDPGSNPIVYEEEGYKEVLTDRSIPNKP